MPSPDTDVPVDVSVILVNYNTRDLLPRAIGALRASSGILAAETIIIDNASRDDSVEIIRRQFPDCTLIANHDNVGFGRANNQAIPLLRGRYALLLNTDAFMAPDTLQKTVTYMDNHPECGILGARLTGQDGAMQPSARYFPTPWNRFLARTGLSRFFPAIRMVDDLGWDHASVRACDWVPGCYYLVRKTLIDQIGLFDPRYFLYYEEVDHCFNAKKAGWQVVCYPHTSVIHLGGESAKSDGEITQAGKQIEALQIESELLYFRKNHGPHAAWLNALLLTTGDIAIVVKRLLKLQFPLAAGIYFRHALLVWTLFRRTRWGTRPTR